MSDAVDKMVQSMDLLHAELVYRRWASGNIRDEIVRRTLRAVAEDCAAVAFRFLRCTIHIDRSDPSFKDHLRAAGGCDFCRRAEGLARTLEVKYGLTDNPGATPPRDP